MRLFVAVWPPDPVIDRLAALTRPVQRGIRWTTAGQWHVTLCFLGSVADVERVKTALVRLEPPGRLTAMAGPSLERLGPGILCVPVAGLRSLAEAVILATAGIGEPQPDRAWKGHLTLARAKAGADLGPLTGTAFDATWPVEEFTLVASQTHPLGARYEVIARYPVGQ